MQTAQPLLPPCEVCGAPSTNMVVNCVFDGASNGFRNVAPGKHHYYCDACAKQTSQSDKKAEGKR